MNKNWAIRIIGEAYVYPAMMLALTYLPGINLTVYTGHGGLGRIFVLFSFPWVLFWFALDCYRQKAETMKKHMLFTIFGVLIYGALCYPLGLLADLALHSTAGLDLGPNGFWKAMTFPISGFF